MILSTFHNEKRVHVTNSERISHANEKGFFFVLVYEKGSTLQASMPHAAVSQTDFLMLKAFSLHKMRSNHSKGISEMLQPATDDMIANRISTSPEMMRVEMLNEFKFKREMSVADFPQYYAALKSYYYDANIIKFPPECSPSLRKGFFLPFPAAAFSLLLLFFFCCTC